METTRRAARPERFALHRDPHPAQVATFAEDVRAGFSARPYRLSPKYFYDDVGSMLFETITRLPEYYLTRIERELLERHASHTVDHFDGTLELLELGRGSALKTRLMIDAILNRQTDLVFSPIDISPDALIDSSESLSASIDTLSVQAYAGDYFSLLGSGTVTLCEERTLALYLGSNVGNFDPSQAQDLFALLGKTLRSGDGLLIGYDLKKDRATLERAYNDSIGVTAAFNRNLLARINRELGANFDIDAFVVYARYDETIGAVCSFLRSEREHTVSIIGAGIDVHFQAGDTIQTESSYKFAQDELLSLVLPAGFYERQTFTDSAQRYALTLLIRE